MNVDKRKLRTRILPSIAIIFSIALLGTYANGELKDYDGLDGRTYHAEMREKGKSRTCNGVNEPDGYPEDGACSRCHDVAELAEATKPEEKKTAGRILITNCITERMCPALSVMESIQTRRRFARTAITSSTRNTITERGLITMLQEQIDDWDRLATV